MDKMMKTILILALLIALPSTAMASAAGTALGFQVLEIRSQTETNALVSPYSLAALLLMAAEGAKGETLSALLQALGAQEPGPLAAADPTVQSANAAFVTPEITLDKAYADRLNAYGAQVFSLDENAQQAVNAWVDAQTDGRIPALLDKAPDERMRLILINALALDAQWASPFQSYDTFDEPFTGADGEQTVPFLHQENEFPYKDADGVQIVQLPYADSALSMYVLLPEENALPALLARLSAEGLDVLADLEPTQLSLALPKLRLDSAATLNEPLIAQGLALPFSEDADFSGMTGQNDLFIGEVSQKTYLILDEDGTRAAAATQTSMAAKSALIRSQPMTVNRPFALVIADSATGTVYFAGAVSAIPAAVAQNP